MAVDVAMEAVVEVGEEEAQASQNLMETATSVASLATWQRTVGRRTVKWLMWRLCWRPCRWTARTSTPVSQRSKRK